MELLIGKTSSLLKILKFWKLRPFTSRHAKNNVRLCNKMKKIIIWVQLANNRTYSVFIKRRKDFSLAQTHTVGNSQKSYFFCCL